MADRKQFVVADPADKELLALLKAASEKEITETDLHEQRISFAYGNAMNSDNITKKSVRRSSQNMLLRA